MSRNITEVHLLNVPLENDYLHTFWFSDQASQESYFKSKVVQSYADFSYQRKDQIIRVNHDFDEIIGCNYVMYRNNTHSTKWYYAFITDMKYVSEGRTDIQIETDVIQTWLFDYTLKPCFVEREHCNNDRIGLHTIPENVEMGDYTINDSHAVGMLTPSDKIVMGCTVVPTEAEHLSNGGIYNGIYSGVSYYCYDTNGITDVLQYLGDQGAIDSVSSLFLAPKFLIPNDGDGIVNETTTAASMTTAVSANREIDGYVPKNKKLYCYPYNFLLVSNGNGAVAEYRYEWFDTDDCNFVIKGALTPGCSIRLIPQDYRGHEQPNTEGLNLGKYPQCNWATDQYTNWLTQNGVNVGTSYASGLMSMISGGIVGAGVGMKMGAVGGAAGIGLGGIAGGIMGAMNGFSTIANTLNDVKVADRVPPQFEGNINCGDVITSMGENTFTFYSMSVRYEYAQIIDHFFTCYGYKTHLVKTPFTNHRNSYWFTKTQGCNIDGAIPMNDMRKIKACYDNGITFWKDTANFGNYNIDNSII